MTRSSAIKWTVSHAQYLRCLALDCPVGDHFMRFIWTWSEMSNSCFLHGDRIPRTAPSLPDPKQSMSTPQGQGNGSRFYALTNFITFLFLSIFTVSRTSSSNWKQLLVKLIQNTSTQDPATMKDSKRHH